MTPDHRHPSTGVADMATPLTVVIFGASGDLTSRKLIPALFNLAQKGRLPAEAKVLGVSRTPFTDDAFRDHLADKAKYMFAGAGEPFDAAKWAEFAKRIHYVSADAHQARAASSRSWTGSRPTRAPAAAGGSTTSRSRRSSTPNSPATSARPG